MTKRLDVISEKDLQKSNVQFYKEDLEHEGWVTVNKAWDVKNGWMKSTKRLQVPGGHIYQVSTEFTNPDGSKSVAEAVTFVPYIL